MNNPVWEWLVRSKLNAYMATERLKGPSALEAGAGWCFDRFGQSSTQLSDGRIVLIAGEHEDYYDPDFFIYNDVVILHPDGRMDIFGYPTEVFPPTDFHTATLVANRIIIIGSFGYPKDRKPGVTPMAVLDLETFAVSKVITAGPSPGWLHSHSAVLTVVRYVENNLAIQMTVEGDLPQATVQALTSDLVEKLSALENTQYELNQL